MIEPKPVGHLRATMRNRTSPAIRQQATEARRAFHAAVKAVDAITRAGGSPEAVEAALEPYLVAARALPVKPDDAG